MISGHLDYETGKWVDDPPEPEQDPAAVPAGMLPAQTAQVGASLATPMPPSAADKARLLLQRRQGAR